MGKEEFSLRLLRMGKRNLENIGQEEEHILERKKKNEISQKKKMGGNIPRRKEKKRSRYEVGKGPWQGKKK